jgi:3-oxoacyl-[acyl-carrier protein] reductase
MKEGQRKEFSAAAPLGRLGDSNEIAEAILFLSMDASSYITGATLDVSGGLHDVMIMLIQAGHPTSAFSTL